MTTIENHSRILSVETTDPPRGIRVYFEALAGSNMDVTQRNFHLTFLAPAPTHRDRGAYAQLQMQSLAIATGLIDPMSESVPTYTDFILAEGRQIAMQMRVEPSPGAFDRVSIWHVDDPAAAAIPKCTAAIVGIPLLLRRDVAWFARLYSRYAQAGRAQ